MDTKARAALVRAIRCEMKQEAVYYVARERQRRSRERFDAQNRRQREVYSRVARRIEAHPMNPFSPAARAREEARVRALNMREAERIRREGYDISPEFRRRSAAMARTQAEVAAQSRVQGVGISSRWRGGTRQAGINARVFRNTEREREAAILAQRRQDDPLTQDPTTFNPTSRRRVRGRVVYHDRTGDRSETTLTDRPPPRRRN